MKGKIRLLAVVALCVLLIQATPLLTESAIKTDNRNYVSTNFMIELNGSSIGFVKNVTGGNATAEVIKEAAGPTYYQKKHIGQPKYEDIVIQVSTNIDKPLYDWITEFVNGQSSRKNGAIVSCDYNYKVTNRTEFYDALITEVSFPAADGSSKEPGYITVRLAPEYTRIIKGKAGEKVTPGNSTGTQQKVMMPSNFRFSLDGFNTSKVNKVDAITIKQSVVQDDIGDARDYLKEPGKMEYPNVSFEISETEANPFYAWHEDFVIQGNNDDSKEKNGTLDFLTPNRQQVLFNLKFNHMGIFRINAPPGNPNDGVRRVRCEMYCERMEFKWGSGSSNTGGGSKT